MKKPRPSKAMKAVKRARKAAFSGATNQVERIDLSIGEAPPAHRTDAWKWHQNGAGRAPAKRCKGPPPPVGKAKIRPTGAGPDERRPTSKLSPALLNRLASPLVRACKPTPLHHRAEVTLAAALFLPAVLTLVLMSALPHLHATQPQIATERAIDTTNSTTAARTAQGKPFVVSPLRISRALEPLGAPDPRAQMQLAAVTRSLVRDVLPLRVSPTIATIPDISAALSALLPEPTPLQPAPNPRTRAELTPAPRADEAAPRLCSAPQGFLEARSVHRHLPSLTPDAGLVDNPLRFGEALAAAAVAQTHELVIYNAKYMSISYPRGDVPALFGVCTDVVIRAYRALEIDLQELVHQTRSGGPSDANIDHRRTELLRGFFASFGDKLPITPYIEDYLPGDIVTYYRPQNHSSTAHIAIVTAETAPSGRPMIAHNRGWGVQLEDALFVDEMTGHYRFRGLSANAVAKLKRTSNVADARSTLPVAARLVGVAADAAQPGHKPGLVRLTHVAVSQPIVAAKTLRPPMGLGVSSKNGSTTGQR